jgi:type I restriction enzyme S subunit
LEFYSTNSLSWEQLDYNDGDIKNLHYGLIHVGLPTNVDLSKDELPYIKSEYIPKNFTICKDGDIAFADASEDTNEVAKVIEFVNVDNQNVVCGLHTIHGRDKLDATIIGFKGYAFSSIPFHHQIRKIAQGTKIYSISTKNFSECTIGVPSKAEQQKIADLMAKIDARIATQKKVIERLETLINGLNNRLHECYANSIESSFDELGYDYNGLSGKTADDFGNGKPYIPYVNVNKNAVVCTDNLPLVEIDSKEAQNKVMWGDIIFTLSSETPEEVAIGAVYLGDIKDLYLNSFCFGIRITDNVRVYKPYMAYFVSSRMFRRFVFPLAQGSTRYNLHKVDFMEKRFLLPSYENQVKISNLLTAYSTKIAVERQLLVRLNTQKLVLLSKLFI